MSGDLKLIGVKVKGYKRLELFECAIDPDKGIVTVGGQNGAGKSSLLDAILAALVRPDPRTKSPVNANSEKADIMLAIGTSETEIEYKVWRGFTRGGSLAIKVQRGGSLLQDSAGALNDLLGKTFVDPIQFIEMQPRDQRKTLADLIGLDVTSFDTAIQEAKDSEKRADQHQKSLEAKVQDLPWHDDAPEEELSAAELSRALTEALAHNQKIDSAAQEIEAKRRESDRLIAAAAECDREIERLRELIALQEQKKVEYRTQSAEALSGIPELETLATAEKIDPSHITTKIGEIEALNNKRRDNQARLRARDLWKEAEDQLKVAIEKRKEAESAKRAALARAKFPVPDLGFDADQVTYKGYPFAQASGAEQIRVAVGIALAMRGRLGLLLIKDASKLDNATLEILAAEANRLGAQVICEIVANQTDDGWDKDCDFYIVDGHMESEEERAARTARPEESAS
ncbi:MAG TPA: AAA family ATPase [Pseudobdellovibrionaceae bacterium]|mgnify:FL=1|nr:AAA family ATPase [Pseudobdellovibrionaceae bacterium]